MAHSSRGSLRNNCMAPEQPKKNEGYYSPMRWDRFIKTMRVLGFKDMSNQDDWEMMPSCIRFIPVDSDSTPISFYKPYPNPTLWPSLLEHYIKRMSQHYDISADQFFDAAGR
ncbi:hypothetical protein NLI96_g8355 [Meripilus lineatus]|uniref:Uncharacterized protein n=1 Tax=Meripilus lineatus TaxID=2056292 RepID=A0AAD5YC29_9APHY|nr:hypothetical protein NLI96_g8355 [Physisporinus lineatus]